MSSSPQVLIATAVDPAALSDFGGADHVLTHEAMVTALLDHANLTLGAGDASALFKAIDGLESPHSRSQWNELLVALSWFNRLDDQETRPASIEHFLAELQDGVGAGDGVQLAIVGKAGAGQWETDLRTGSHEVNGTSVVRPPFLSHASPLRQAREIGSFADGTPRDLIADELIRPLASRSRVVKILDPHLMDHVLRTAKGRRLDHTEWLVSVLASVMPEGATIELIADMPTARTVDDNGDELPLSDARARNLIEDAIHGALVARGADPIHARVTLVRAHPKKNPNRYLWFSCGVTLEITHDFARLGTPRIWERVKFTRQRGEDSDHVVKTAESYEQFASAAAKLQITISNG